MRTLSISLLVLFAAFLAAACPDDDGLVTWSKGYPKKGPKPGQILVKVDVQPATNYKVVSGEVALWPKDGGEVKTTKIKLDKDGTLPVVTVSGLEKGMVYNIVVEVTEKFGAVQQVRATQPLVVSTPSVEK